MRKFLLVLVMYAACNSALAEWVKVDNNEAVTFYADPATIIKSANMVKMQALHDYKTARKAAGDTLLSSVAQEEYDCKKNQSRVHIYSFYSKNMGKGRKVHTDTESREWQPVRPGSVKETLWLFACKNK